MSTRVGPCVAVLLGMFGALAGSLTACTNDSPSLRVVTVVPPASMPIRFSTDVQPIFDRSCAGLSCHTGNSPAQALNLEPGNSYQSLVNVQSTEVTSLRRVNPGRSDLSYLVDKIEGSSVILGSRMPANSPPLPPAEIQVIRDWIDQGADNH